MDRESLNDPVKNPVLPWNKLSWSKDHIKSIYRDWAIFFNHKLQMKSALVYFNKAFELGENDYITLLHRSILKRQVSKPEEALLDGLAAAKIRSTSYGIDLEISDAIYECNRLEDTKIKLSNDARKYAGKKLTPFLTRLDVVDENLMDSLGDSLGPFILKNGKVFPTVIEDQRRKNFVDPRPLWKQLRDQGKCDILSIPEVEEILLSPREIARRERTFRVMNQIYLNKSWRDVLFLKDLEANPNFLLPISEGTSNQLQTLLCDNKIAVKKFVKMLQVRSPLYNELMRRCPNLKIADQHREKYLYRVQYQTRRNMIIVLRNIHLLRKLGQINKLIQYTESVMGDYVVLKTHRVMPWKFEFLCDVYNTLALAYSDVYVIPESLDSKQKRNIAVLLRLPKEKFKDQVEFVFGDKSTRHNPDIYNAELALQRQFLDRMRKRLHFAKYAIEMAYIFHEMAKSHFLHNNYDECVSTARKSIQVAKEGNSLIWAFLSSMLIVKSRATLKKLEYLREDLTESLNLASLLKSPTLIDFVTSCQNINENEVSNKIRMQSMAAYTLRKSKSRLLGSQASVYSVLRSDQTRVDSDDSL